MHTLLSKLHNRRQFMALTGFALGVLLAALPSRAADEKAKGPQRFEKEIVALEAAAKANPLPKDAILFVGSSSIKRWTNVAKDFPQFKVINHGFGGSQIEDSVYYADRIIIPFQPKIIVFYAGGNDINAHKTPERVFGDFKEFVQKANAALPKTRIVYISIAGNPSRWTQVEEVKATNKLIEDFTHTDKRLSYVDVFHSMLGSDGKPLPDIFVADNLHMNPKGYAIWVSIVGPHLQKLLDAPEH